MSDYTVCRASDLRIGDQFLDPHTGALAKVSRVERISGTRPIKIHMTLTVAHTAVSIELPEARPMRRRWREGEERYGATKV